MILTLLFSLTLLAQPEPVADLLIDGPTIVTMDPQWRVLEGGAVVVRDNRITRVLSAEDQRPEAGMTLDARGHLLIPGLVNTHGHVAMTLFRGLADDLSVQDFLHSYIFPAEAKNVTPEFVYWGTRLGCLEMARAGITTFADMYYFEEEAARATSEVGLRGVLGQTIIGFPAPDYGTAREALVGTERFLERFAEHPLIVPSVAPHALYTTPIEVIRDAREMAREHGVPLQIHAAETEDETATIAALDEAGILVPGTLLHHAIALSDHDVERIAASGASVSHNPESNMKTAAGLARVPELLEAGVAVGLGSDGPASNNNLDLFEEMDTAAKLHKIVRRDPTLLDARTVFEMATLGGARALGLEDRVGSIEEGKLADLVLIDLSAPELVPLYDVYSHLVYTIKGGHVTTVIVDGRIVVRDRNVVTVDTAEVVAKARELQVKIRESLER